MAQKFRFYSLDSKIISSLKNSENIGIGADRNVQSSPI